jgi:hypothetical protein
MKTWMLSVVCVTFSLVWSGVAQCQSTIHVPGDSKFVLQVDLQSLKSSKLGATLLKAAEKAANSAQKAAIEQAGKKLGKDELSLAKIQEILGMDPFEEIQGIMLCASDFENPEKSLLGMVRLKKTTGNIEGLMLALPGYEKTDHGRYEIHSASPSDDAKFFGAIHTNETGNHTLIVGVNKVAVTHLLDSLDAKQNSNTSLKAIDLESDRKMIATIQLLEIPNKKVVGEGPQANIAALLNSFALSVFEEEDELEVRGNLAASTEKQADKIRQSLQGLSAMIELFASMDEQDDDTRQVLGFLKQVKVTQDGSAVRVKFRMPSAQIAEWIQREMDN